MECFFFSIVLGGAFILFIQDTMRKLFGKSAMGVVKEYIDESKDNGSTKVLVQYRSCGKTLIWTDE